MPKCILCGARMNAGACTNTLCRASGIADFEISKTRDNYGALAATKAPSSLPAPVELLSGTYCFAGVAAALTLDLALVLVSTIPLDMAYLAIRLIGIVLSAIALTALIRRWRSAWLLTRFVAGYGVLIGMFALFRFPLLVAVLFSGVTFWSWAPLLIVILLRLGATGASIVGLLYLETDPVREHFGFKCPGCGRIELSLSSEIVCHTCGQIY